MVREEEEEEEETTYLDAKGVEPRVERRVRRLALDVVAPPSIILLVRPKVQRAADDVVAALAVREVVAAGLHDVELAGPRPRPVHAVRGQHPDGGPQPVALGQLGLDLDAAVRDGRATACVEARGFDRVHDGAVGRVGGCHAVLPARAGAAVAAEVDYGAVVVDEVSVLEGGLDGEDVVFDVGVCVVGCCLLELAVSVCASCKLRWYEGGSKGESTHP